MNKEVTAVDSDNADYVPMYDAPQLFRWNGYWLEVRDDQASTNQQTPYEGPRAPVSLSIKWVTLVHSEHELTRLTGSEFTLWTSQCSLLL